MCLSFEYLHLIHVWLRLLHNHRKMLYKIFIRIDKLYDLLTAAIRLLLASKSTHHANTIASKLDPASEKSQI